MIDNTEILKVLDEVQSSMTLISTTFSKLAEKVAKQIPLTAQELYRRAEESYRCVVEANHLASIIRGEKHDG